MVDSSPGLAAVQAWAKGFRVSERSSEFQLIIPTDASELETSERALAILPWGEIVQPFYRLKPGALAREFALLLNGDVHAATLVAAAHSEDKGGRTSIVVVAATIDVDWSNPNLGRQLATARSLCFRLATAYGAVLRGAKPELEKQLRERRFLRDRSFNLYSESPDTDVDWAHLVREIKRWKGVRGAATRNFLALGANVLYGTRDEAERSRAAGLDGYFDVARGELTPLTPGLVLWPQPSPLLPEEPVAEAEPADPLEAIQHQLDRMEQQQTRTFSLLETIYDGIRAFWGLPDGRRRSRGKKR